MDFRILRSKKKIKIKITRQEVVNGIVGFPGGSAVKNLPANAGDSGSIPGSGSSPRQGSGNSLQYSCLRNPKDNVALQDKVHGVKEELDTT